MPLKRKRQDSEDDCPSPAPKQITFEGQVVKLKLTNDGEPDMRFAVGFALSKRLFAMQTWNMKKALGIDLILERIFEHLPYADLKTARSVNSFWNQIANPVFRKRSILDLLYFIEKEAALRNQNIVAKVPLKFKCTWSTDDCRLLSDAIQTKPAWFSRVRELSLVQFEAKDFNRFLPFLLYHMPGLEELYFWGFVSTPERFGNLIVPEVPENAMFSLAKLGIDFSPWSKSNFDPKFLRHCPNLKTFQAKFLTSSPQEIIGFFEDWKKIRTDSMQYENIEIQTKYWNVTDEDKNALCKTLAEFINLNQCRSLNIDSETSYLWTSRVLPRLEGTNLRQLKLSLPSNSDFFFPLQILKQYPAFSKVTDLTLVGCYNYDADFVPEFDPSLVTHNFEAVNSLTLVSSTGYDSTYVLFQGKFTFFCEKIKFLQNLTSVRLIDRNWPEILDIENFDKMFRGLTVFHKLNELDLVLGVGGYNYDFPNRVEEIRKKVRKGIFVNLGILTCLRKLKVTYCSDEFNDFENALVAFFNGYEPHVQLVMNRRRGFTHRQNEAEWTFTVEEFKKALKAAEALLLAD